MTHQLCTSRISHWWGSELSLVTSTLFVMLTHQRSPWNQFVFAGVRRCPASANVAVAVTAMLPWHAAPHGRQWLQIAPSYPQPCLDNYRLRKNAGHSTALWCRARHGILQFQAWSLHGLCLGCHGSDSARKKLFFRPVQACILPAGWDGPERALLILGSTSTRLCCHWIGNSSQKSSAI